LSGVPVVLLEELSEEGDSRVDVLCWVQRVGHSPGGQVVRVELENSVISGGDDPRAVLVLARCVGVEVAFLLRDGEGKRRRDSGGVRGVDDLLLDGGRHRGIFT